MNYDPTMVKVLVMKALESTHLIISSKNVDIVVGRYNEMIEQSIILQGFSLKTKHIFLWLIDQSEIH